MSSIVTSVDIGLLLCFDLLNALVCQPINVLSCDYEHCRFNEYLASLREAGLEKVGVKDRLVYDAAQLKAFLQLEVTGSVLSDPCSCGGFLTGELLGRAGEVLAGKIWSALFIARKPR